MDEKLFIDVLREFDKVKVLDRLILIGSWCLPLYQSYFKNDKDISFLRTLDIDLLIPKPDIKDIEVNIKDVLEKLDFKEEPNYPDGDIKYMHMDMDIEFLVPEMGPGKGGHVDIPFLHTKALALRSMDILTDNIMKVDFHGIKVKIPEPSAFVLQKFYIAERRQDENKRDKDLATAKELGEFLLTLPEQEKKLLKVFGGLFPKMQKEIIKTVEKQSPKIFEKLT